MKTPASGSNGKNKLEISEDIVAEFTVHSMLHSATVEMDPTKLELLEGFEKTEPGHQYSPENTNVKIVISGRDWSQKKFLVYGSGSTAEASQHVEEVVEKVQDIEHNITIQEGPDIINLAINGSFGHQLNLEDLYGKISGEENHVEYEPEQFPGVKLPIKDPSCTFLLFSTGTFVVQGLNNKSDINPTIKRVAELIFG